MTPTLRQLEALVLVYRLGSITKAAAELRVTQSAISLLIRQVEENFQLRLFDRTTRALHPTAACREAIPAAERILAGAQGLSRRMRDLAEIKAGRIAIAVSAGVASALLPRVFAAFRARHPEVSIDLLDVAPDELFAIVMAGEAEFGLGSVEDEGVPEVRIEPLVRSPLSAIGIRDGRFENSRRLTWDSVMSSDLITMRRGTRIRGQIDDALARTGRTLKPVLEVSLITTALALTAEGAGISILPGHMLPRSQFPTLAAVPLSQPTIHRHVSLLSRADFGLSPAAQQFVAIAKRVVLTKDG
ncbi:putative LysR-family transcriptional regulator [Bradyrhizobium sp. ORS 375]|uniref:LysR family transcriptional regulator n=1 Tax=Bradyrhizobium sp. (strain ORS 375) TaxID=566679 RepID=UPI0002407AC2|nr:LysR family transcriptional regulator [Bradyrhizobium sp. ORS 375]CCD95448.1 putative LysR-family transcriptional regulator [Bradyrhizobium sp. ORS 375]